MTTKPLLSYPVYGRGIAKGTKRLQMVSGTIDVGRFGPGLYQMTRQTEHTIDQWVMTPAEVHALARVLASFWTSPRPSRDGGLGAQSEEELRLREEGSRFFGGPA